MLSEEAHARRKASILKATAAVSLRIETKSRFWKKRKELGFRLETEFFCLYSYVFREGASQI